jgi:hypothetical protein
MRRTSASVADMRYQQPTGLPTATSSKRIKVPFGLIRPLENPKKAKASGRKASSSFFEKKEPKNFCPFPVVNA